MNVQKKEDICSAKQIAQSLIETARENEEFCEDDTCFLVYSLLKDCGYKIKKVISESENHYIEC